MRFEFKKQHYHTSQKDGQMNRQTDGLLELLLELQIHGFNFNLSPVIKKACYVNISI